MAKPKGPTWAQIGDPKQGNLIEHQPGHGYKRKIEEMGRTRVLLICPFCRGELWAYLWSLAGGGKRCDCGALIGGSGEAYHFADRKKT